MSHDSFSHDMTRHEKIYISIATVEEANLFAPLVLGVVFSLSLGDRLGTWES